MPQRPLFLRYWWLLLLLVGASVAGGLRYFASRSTPPRPSITKARSAPKPARHIPAVLSSPLGSEEHIAAVGDFNSDGHLDLALTNGDDSPSKDPQGSVSLWWGDGRGGLRHGPALEGIEATLLATLDADGDGDDDLLAGSCCEENLLLWRNDGHGKLTPTKIPSEHYAEDLTVGDIDGDGDPDLVRPMGWQYSFGINDGHGHFAWRLLDVRNVPLEPDDNIETASLVDVDGDHDLDLLSVSIIRGGCVLINNGKGQFGQGQRLWEQDGESVAIGDLDGDGAPDLALADGEKGVSLALNDGRGHLGEGSRLGRLTYPVRFGVNWVGLTDVDHDGDLDLVLNTLNDVWVQLNDGRAHFDPPYQVDLPGFDREEVLLADMNHDGQPEFLAPVLAGRPPARRPTRSTLPTLPRPTDHELYIDADQLPTAADGTSAEAAMAAAMQARLVLPPGYVLTAERATYIVEVEVGTDGALRHPYLQWQSLTPRVDSLMLKALRGMPPLVPARLHGRPVRVRLSLTPRLVGQGPYRPAPPPTPVEPEPDAAAERREAATHQRGRAQRQPGETTGAFLRRVLPLAYFRAGWGTEPGRRFLTSAWRPDAFGKQLFLQALSPGEQPAGTSLLVLDPYQPNTYAVQRLHLTSIEGEPTGVAALFFADANHDGRKELLVLLECSLRDVLDVDKRGRRFYGHVSHYQTQVFQYLTPGRNGRPRYREDLTPRPYLDELPTAAAVRRALARH